MRGRGFVRVMPFHFMQENEANSSNVRRWTASPDEMQTEPLQITRREKACR